MAPPPPPPLPKWERGPLLGRGSTAAVSLAITTTSTTFAVKSADIQTSAPLQREQRLLSSIPSSPHLISYLGFDLTPTHFNLFLEYAPGGSLSDHIAGKRLDDEHQIRSFTRDILCGLSHLHSLSIAHRDVKSRNVLLAADGSAKLADFGCARSISDDDLSIAGTPLFLSPEAARGEEQGTAADVWALGCTVVEMATGQPPWSDVDDAVSALHRIGFSGESPAIPDSLSPEARDFLRRCFEMDPYRRPSADELLDHQFVASVSPSPKTTIWRSPKCVLDRDLWDSLEDDDDDEPSTSPVGESDASERIQQLAGGNSFSGFSSDDDEDWITIRCAPPPDHRSPVTEPELLKRRPSYFGSYESHPLGFVVNACGFPQEESLFCPYVSVFGHNG